MTYVKSLFFNFLIVFFVNHVLPGIEPGDRKLPHIGPDLIYAFALGLLNSLIYPILRMIQPYRIGLSKIALIALVINFVSYAIVKLAPLGIEINTLEGFLIAALIVTLGSILTNYLEWKHAQPKAPKPPVEPPKAP